MMENITKDDIRRITNIANAVLRAYPHHSITRDDLFQEGVLGFLEAKSRYNPEKNNYFWGYAFRRVKGSMLDYVRKVFRRVKHENYLPSDTLIDYVEENSHISNDYLIQSEDLIKEYFRRMNNLTALEQQIIYSYFMLKIPIYKLAATYKVKRRKVSLILSNTLNYIKESFE